MPSRKPAVSREVAYAQKACDCTSDRMCRFCSRWLKASMATPAQRRMMFALWHQHGVEDRRIRLAVTSGYVRRIVRSSSTLTRREAARVIDRLQDPNVPFLDRRHSRRPAV